jgi:hypothetical protein
LERDPSFRHGLELVLGPLRGYSEQSSFAVSIITRHEPIAYVYSQ